ncbi:MAG: hypothetical protein ABSH52_01480 [Terriglobia bacterium]|jgi:hypothetical protein
MRKSSRAGADGAGVPFNGMCGFARFLRGGQEARPYAWFVGAQRDAPLRWF